MHILFNNTLDSLPHMGFGTVMRLNSCVDFGAI